MAILKAEHIDKFFHQPTEFQVLKDISFEVNKGELLTLVGKSGCGKSTLLYILSTMDTEYSGDLRIDGEKVTGLSLDNLATLRNNKIGFVFQFHYLLPEFTCLKNIMIPALKLGKYAPKEIEERAYQKLEILGLSNQALKPLQDLKTQLAGLSSIPKIYYMQERAGDLLDDAMAKIAAFIQANKPKAEPDQTATQTGPVLKTASTSTGSVAAEPKPVRVIKPSDLAMKSYLETETEVEDYIARLKSELLGAITSGHRARIQ